MSTSPLSPNFRIPVGTQVVLKVDYSIVGRTPADEGQGRFKKAGSVGVVTEAKKLEAELEPAAERSHLPEEVPNWDALNAFLVRMRMGRS